MSGIDPLATQCPTNMSCSQNCDTIGCHLLTSYSSSGCLMASRISHSRLSFLRLHWTTGLSNAGDFAPRPRKNAREKVVAERAGRAPPPLFLSGGGVGQPEKVLFSELESPGPDTKKAAKH